MKNNTSEIYETEGVVTVTFTIGSDGRGHYCYADENQDCEAEADLIYDRSFGG